jgi:hypothetical protein
MFKYFNFLLEPNEEPAAFGEDSDVDESLNTFSFRVKSFIFRRLCCKNRIMKWIMFLDDDFEENSDTFDKNLEKLASRLNLQNILQTDSVIQDELILNNDASSVDTRMSIKDALMKSKRQKSERRRQT